MTVTFIIVALFIFTGVSSWQGRDITFSRLLDLDIILSIFVLIPSFLIFALLRHQIAWMFVLVVLAFFGTGMLLPYFVIVFPEKLSLTTALMVLLFTLSFWLVERFEAKYLGIQDPVFGSPEPVGDEDDIITLDLGAEQKK